MLPVASERSHWSCGRLVNIKGLLGRAERGRGWDPAGNEPAGVTIYSFLIQMPDPLVPVLGGSIDMATAVARIEQRVGKG